MKKIITTQIVDDNGNVIDKSIKIEEVSGHLGTSMFARRFDENSVAWTKNPEFNIEFIRHQEQYLNNNVLQSKGMIFLNEVYDALGLSRTAVGQIVGWTKDSKIDIRIIREENRRDMILDFNVQGAIIKYL